MASAGARRDLLILLLGSSSTTSGERSAGLRGIASGVAKGLALAQQVPTLIQLDLDLVQPERCQTHPGFRARRAGARRRRRSARCAPATDSSVLRSAIVFSLSARRSWSCLPQVPPRRSLNIGCRSPGAHHTMAWFFAPIRRMARYHDRVRERASRSNTRSTSYLIVPPAPQPDVVRRGRTTERVSVDVVVLDERELSHTAAHPTLRSRTALRPAATPRAWTRLARAASSYPSRDG